MKLSIIIPCYNEDQTIKSLLQELFKVKFPIDKKIIVIDGGSYRDHKEILEDEIKNNTIKFIRISQNQGKGVAIRVGLKHASGDIFIIQDADFEYSPIDIPRLLEPILKKETNVVYGTRLSIRPKKMVKSHYFANVLLTKITNFIYKSNLTDMETGYKLFTKKILEKISLKTREFEFEPEITSKIILSGFKIKEIPILYQYRKFGQAKINWLDGLEGILILIQQRFCPDSKLYQFIYDTYKFHVKKVINKISKFITKCVHLRRI